MLEYFSKFGSANFFISSRMTLAIFDSLSICVLCSLIVFFFASSISFVLSKTLRLSRLPSAAVNPDQKIREHARLLSPLVLIASECPAGEKSRFDRK